MVEKIVFKRNSAKSTGFQNVIKMDHQEMWRNRSKRDSDYATYTMFLS